MLLLPQVGLVGVHETKTIWVKVEWRISGITLIISVAYNNYNFGYAPVAYPQVVAQTA